MKPRFLEDPVQQPRPSPELGTEGTEAPPAAAADAAVAVGANREGIGYLETALELTGEHPEAVSREQVASLRLKLAGLHFVVGER